MANKLSGKDFAGKSFFDALIKADKELKDLLKTFVRVGKEARAVSKAIAESKGFNQLAADTKKATDATQRFAKSERDLIKQIQKARFESTQAGKKLAVQRERTRQATKANRDYARSVVGATKNTNTWQKALGSFATKFNSLGNIISNVVTSIARSVKRALRGAFDTIAGFEQAMADVGAITQATSKDFDLLRESAKKLGATTKFTASEVAGLQKEYAKLGLSTEEILNAQAATLDLAAAFGNDLSRSAEVVGITLRQFNLDARETKRVVDVMTKSFIESPLDLERFAEAMKFVGTAARVSGLSLEETTARLGQLARAGLFGSQAGTAFRQILLATADSAGTFSEKIERAAAEGINLADAAEDVQRRAATALVVLEEGVGTIDEFTLSLINSGDVAEDIAKKQLDTLRNQLVILKSAYDGLIISIGDSDGAIEGTKKSIGSFAKVLNFLTIQIEKNNEETTTFRESRKAVRRGVIATIPVIGSLARAFGFLREVAEELPDSLDDATEAVEELGKGFLVAERDAKGLADALGNIGKPIPEQTQNLKLLEEQLSDLNKQRKEASITEIAIIDREIAALQKQIAKFNESKKAIEDAKKELEDYIKTVEKFTKALDISEQGIEDWMTEMFKLSGSIQDVKVEAVDVSDILDKLFKTEPNLKGQEESNDLFAQTNETLKALIVKTEELYAAGIIGEERYREVIGATTDLLNARTLANLESLVGLANATSDIVANIFESQIQQIDLEKQKQIEAFEAKAAAGIISEEKLQSNRVRIEKKAATEIAKIRRKQAVADKAAAIFSIAINTAVAAMTVAGQTGVGAVVAVPLVIALGAAQIAAVLAEPIPKFAKGVKSSPAGPAIVGEKGSELMISNGRIGLTPNEPTLMNLGRGTEIIPADITNQILKYAVVKSAMGDADDGMVNMMLKELREVRQAIKSKPVSSSSMTPAGILTATNRGNTTIKKLDKFFM